MNAKYNGTRSPVEILFPHVSSCSLAFWDKFCKPYWQKICFWVSWPGDVVISISKLLYFQSTELFGHNIFLTCDFIKCGIMSWNLPAWTSLFAEVTVSWEYFQLWMYAVCLQSELLALTNVACSLSLFFSSQAW